MYWCLSRIDKNVIDFRKEMECVEDAKQAFLIAHESLHSNLQSASLCALCETQRKEQQCIATSLHRFGLARSLLPKLAKQVVKAMFNEERGHPQPTVYVGEGHKQTWHQLEELFDDDASWSNIPWSPSTILKVLQTVCSQGHCNLTSFGQLRVCNAVGRKLCALCPVVLINVPRQTGVLVRVGISERLATERSFVCYA